MAVKIAESVACLCPIGSFGDENRLIERTKTATGPVENGVAEIGIKPAPRSPMRNDLRKQYYAKQIGYQHCLIPNPPKR